MLWTILMPGLLRVLREELVGVAEVVERGEGEGDLLVFAASSAAGTAGGDEGDRRCAGDGCSDGAS